MECVRRTLKPYPILSAELSINVSSTRPALPEMRMRSWELQWHLANLTVEEGPGAGAGPAMAYDVALCLLLTWAVAGAGVMAGIRIFGKLGYASIAYGLFFSLFLLVLGLATRGGRAGMRRLFADFPCAFQEGKSIVWTKALSHIFASNSLGTGYIATLASYYGLRDDAFRDVLLVTSSDLLFTFLPILLAFPSSLPLEQKSGRFQVGAAAGRVRDGGDGVGAAGAGLPRHGGGEADVPLRRPPGAVHHLLGSLPSSSLTSSSLTPVTGAGCRAGAGRAWSSSTASWSWAWACTGRRGWFRCW